MDAGVADWGTEKVVCGKVGNDLLRWQEARGKSEVGFESVGLKFLHLKRSGERGGCFVRIDVDLKQPDEGYGQLERGIESAVGVDVYVDLLCAAFVRIGDSEESVLWGGDFGALISQAADDAFYADDFAWAVERAIGEEQSIEIDFSVGFFFAWPAI